MSLGMNCFGFLKEILAGDPPHSAWGLWEDNHLGSLNYLSDEKLLETAKNEIKTGERISLNLPLDLIDPPFLGRAPFERKIINKAPRVINDDIITFNTQLSSQWDSFRHFAYQKEAKFYNGVTQNDIHDTTDSTAGACSNWNARGVVGRGILIDYYSWARENGIEFDPITNSAIHLDQIKKIISEKNVTLQRGDILFLRTVLAYLLLIPGFVDGYGQLNSSGRESLAKLGRFPGICQSRETAEWLWNHQFAAVAADSPAFECIPPVDHDWMLHPILLSGWGTPIGELFDLDALSEICKRLGRWSFFLTSSPLNYTGAVATPPNAIAIF
ncbi:uncharacterized protein N7477_005261 [Penicillium maclennaniae]|uniref:uncharacterized protein n=1 Tax=Penicillium maclennaniae TaxID=1343394 RepID=UPI002542521A|nr:uncharacterized protein N7477_005261 [Penicillium maclennaniae]KAJ5669898.1 hypothetical protein N7477_005261 [Penicillium maclennaniae]